MSACFEILQCLNTVQYTVAFLMVHYTPSCFYAPFPSTV